MRVLLNGWPITGNRTGIGWYTYRLGAALAEHELVEEVGFAAGGRISSLADAATCGAGGPSPVVAVLRSCARHLLPGFVRRLLLNRRREDLHRRARRWSLFHETNYIAPEVPLPLVTTVCDMSYVRHPEFMPQDRLQWLRRYLESGLQQSQTIISISRFTTDELLTCLPALDPSRVITVPLGVDHGEFHARRSEQEETCLRDRYALPPQFLLYLGTLEPRKNLQGLLAGYALLPRECRRAYPLVLAGGDGWKQSYFRETARNLCREGSLKLLGYVPQADVSGLMRAATLFCFPSIYEGFGLPALEAAACGTAVLCAGNSSLPEVMGDAAEYVDPHCPADIADAMRRVVEDDTYRATLAARGPARAAEFTWERCAQSTVEAYRRAA